MKKTIGIIGNFSFNFIMSLLSGLLIDRIWGIHTFLYGYVVVLTVILGISDIINYMMRRVAYKVIN